MKSQEISQYPEVAVLMATFNGEKWLDDQIASIFFQEKVKVKLYIYDDKSTDGTIKKIEKWMEKDYLIELLQNQPSRLGLPKVYFHLMNLDFKQKFIAFADQDDIWMKDHLCSSIELIQGNKPILVCSPRVILYDKTSVSRKKNLMRKPLEWQNAAIENVIYGNTMVANTELINMTKPIVPNHAVMHDSWLYLFTSIFGEVRLKSSPSIIYRIHDKNNLGTRKLRDLHKIFSRIEGYCSQNFEFISLFMNMKNDNFSNFEKFMSALCDLRGLKRFKFVFSSTVYRQNPLDDLIFRLAFLINRKAVYKIQKMNLDQIS
jgi:glycosyltransferase involved in cell wall biosynthesis